MESTLKYEILNYLRSGNAQSKVHNLALMREWGDEGVDLLKRIMDGRETVENPRIRLKSFFVLGQLVNPKEFKTLLSDTITKGEDQRLRFQAFSALATASASEAATLAPGLLENVEQNPPLAMGAARVLAQVKGKEAIPAIEKLSEEIYQMAGGNANSPSYLSLKALIDDLQRPKEKRESRKKEI